MDGALTFIHIFVDSSQTVLEHHRSFAPFISVLIAAELYMCAHIILYVICTPLTIAPLKKAVTMVLKRSCPAESQICNLILFPSISTVRILKSTPTVSYNSV